MEPLPSHSDYLDRDLAPEGQANHVRDALRVLRKQWLMVLIPLLCVIGVVFVLTKRKPRIYQASTRLLLSPTGTSATGSQVQGILASNQPGSTATQVEILRSPQLMAKAVPERILKRGTPQLAVSQVPDTEVIDLTVWWEDARQAAEIANDI